MKISCYTPILNEIEFLPIYLDNLRDKVDEIVFIDTGSTDGSYEYVKKKEKKNPFIKVYQWDPIKNPYNWEEGKIRNFGREACTHPFVISLSPDEILSDNFNSVIESKNIYGKIACFMLVPFWGDLRTVRLTDDINGGHWYGYSYPKVFDKRVFKYKEGGNHSGLDIDYATDTRFVHIHEIRVFHLHYGMFNRVKANDNQLVQLGLEEYWNTGIKPDGSKANFKLPHIKTQPYESRYPKCLKKYIK